MERKTVVIALGGNALGKDAEEQKEAVAKTAKVIVDLVMNFLHNEQIEFKNEVKIRIANKRNKKMVKGSS